MLRIAVDGQVVGSIGYWEIERNGPAYETGWEILETHHGHGYGTAAARLLLERLKQEAARAPIFSPSRHQITRDRTASAASLASSSSGVEETEYPKGGSVGPYNVLATSC